MHHTHTCQAQGPSHTERRHGCTAIRTRRQALQTLERYKLHRRTVLCYYSRKCRWHRPKPSKIKFIRSTDIRINRKSEVSYKVNSESGAFHRWMHLNTWALMKHTHSYTHLPRLHQLTQRGEGRKGTLHKALQCASKAGDQSVTGKRRNGKTTGSSFLLVSLFLNKHSQGGSSVNKMDSISSRCTCLFSGTCGWFHPQKAINTIQILEEEILKHRDNR